MSILKQILKEAAELDAEVSENDVLKGKVHNAHVDEAEVAENDMLHGKQHNAHVDEAESMNSNEKFVRIYWLGDFIANAESIMKELGQFGFVVLRDTSALYGLLFKSVSAENGVITFKFHVYSYPQEGTIYGGNTFFATSGEIPTALKNAISEVK